MEVEKPTSYDSEDLSRSWLAELDSSSGDVENVPSNSDGDQPKNKLADETVDDEENVQESEAN